MAIKSHLANLPQCGTFGHSMELSGCWLSRLLLEDEFDSGPWHKQAQPEMGLVPDCEGARLLRSAEIQENNPASALRDVRDAEDLAFECAICYSEGGFRKGRSEFSETPLSDLSQIKELSDINSKVGHYSG